MFLLTSFSLSAVILFIVIFGSKHRRLSTYAKSQSLVKVPVNNDDYVGYSDINIHSQRPSCSKVSQNFIVPSAEMKSSLPLPSELSSKVTPSLSAYLSIDPTSGALIYRLNNIDLWKSTSPRTQTMCTEFNVLKSFSAKTPLNEWSYISETANGLRLHLAPLAITKKSELSRKLVWTFFSGWDATALCENRDCEIPSLRNGKESADVVLMSKNRKLRLVFTSSGDLITIEAGAEAPRSTVYASKVKTTLLSSLCA